ncbi:MAG: flavin reductase family protein [Candidatus Omnitrophota bacterium]
MKKSIGAKTIIYPTPVLVVGTYDKAGKPNVMTVSWGGICCSQPPCIAIALRKATYSYDNIRQRKAFTVSIPSEENIADADYFGMASGKTEDKFAATGLTPVKSDVVDAPYVQEFRFVLECALIKTLEIGLHTQFIGEIKDIKVDEDALGRDGLPDIEKINPMIFVPQSRMYYGIGRYLAEAFSVGKGV